MSLSLSYYDDAPSAISVGRHKGTVKLTYNVHLKHQRKCHIKRLDFAKLRIATKEKINVISLVPIIVKMENYEV